MHTQRTGAAGVLLHLTLKTKYAPRLPRTFENWKTPQNTPLFLPTVSGVLAFVTYAPSAIHRMAAPNPFKTTKWRGGSPICKKKMERVGWRKRERQRDRETEVGRSGCDRNGVERYTAYR